MPQLTHDTTEDGFHEIQLSGKQLVFLFMAMTVVSVVIFLCGVLVGRDLRAGRELAGPEEASAVAQQAEVGGSAGAPANVEEPPAPADDPGYSYHERLQQDKPKEELKAPTPEPERAKPGPPPPAAAAPPPEPKTDVPTSGRSGAWVIQVQALSNREVASAVVKGLIAKGYPAFLLRPATGAPAIYRVQIGRYKDRREADQVARRLAKEEQFNPVIQR